MSQYYEVKKNTSINLIFLLILLSIVQLIFNPIKYLKINYYEVKNMELPSYIDEIIKIKSQYSLNYIGHMQVEENIENEIVKMENSFIKFFERNSVTDYIIEKGDDFIFVKTVLPTDYKLYDSFLRTYSINVSTCNIISKNIPSYYKDDFWSTNEKREVVAYILFNNDDPMNLNNLLNKIDDADLGKIFLKFRFIIVWILLFFILINLIRFINATFKIFSYNRMIKQDYKLRKEVNKKRKAIENQIEELKQELISELFKEKALIKDILYRHIDPITIDIKKLEVKTVPQFVTKELNVKQQYEFFKDSLVMLEKYKANINKEEEIILKKCFKNLYETFTLSKEAYFPYEILQSLLLEHNINVPEMIKNMSDQINDLNSSLTKIIEKYKKQLGILFLGLDGERRVLKELNMYDDYFQIISNIRIKYEDMSVEIDNIILCPKGVFLLEVKNLGESGKYSLKISKDGKWSKIIGTKEVSMDNVTSQQNRQVAVVQKLINNYLKDKLGKEIPYIFANPIIVIANDNVDIYNESDIPIYRISNIYRYIINVSSDTLPKEYISEIINVIKSHQVPLKKYPVEDYLTPISIKYSSIIELERQLLSIFNVTNEFADYYYKKHNDKIKQIESLAKELPYDFFNQLAKTFNNVNITQTNNLQFNYIAMKDSI